MKKIFFFAAIAAVGLASCTNEETVKTPNSKAIGFDVFVGKGTRTDVTTDGINQMYVFGSYKSGEITYPVFDNTSVSGGNGFWTYSPERYWVENGIYNFAAYAPEKISSDVSYAYETNILTISSYTVGGDVDLVTAVDNSTYQGKKTGNDAVPFTFKHALSKVQFVITNGWSEDEEITLDLKDVTLSSINSQGTATVNSTTIKWDSQTVSKAVNYGAVTGLEGETSTSTLVKYLLPQDLTDDITLSFDVTVKGYPDGVADDPISVSVTLPVAEIDAWAVGNIYTYNLTLTAKNLLELQPIEFDDIKVEATWSNGGEDDLPNQEIIEDNN